MLGLFSDLMKFTVVNKSLSINKLIFCLENNSPNSLHNQQKEKSTQVISRKICIRSLARTATRGKCAIKDRDFKNYRIFTLRCINKGVIMVSVRLGSIIKDMTNRAKEIIYKVEKQLLQERVRYINVILEDNGKKLETSRSRLLSLVTTTTTKGKCIEFNNKARENRLTKIKETQVNKFNRLTTKVSNWDFSTQSRNNFSQPQVSRSHSNQSQSISNSNKWVVNLSNIPLIPAQQSTCQRPQFCCSPPNISLM